MYKVYRCKKDGKLFIPNQLKEHAGHSVNYGQDESFTEAVKVFYWLVTKQLEKRENYQS